MDALATQHFEEAATAASPAFKAAVLAQALPFLRQHAGHTVLVKYGGHAMGGSDKAGSDKAGSDKAGSDKNGGDPFARDVVLLKQVGIDPIVVHGGGPQIGRMLKRLGIESRFIDGLRVTDRATMEVVEMVLAGTINKELVAAINAAGGCAIGLSGKDGGLIEARKLARDGADLGFVGEPERVSERVLAAFRQSDIIPVIAPIGVGADGETYNINADTVAGAVAAAVRARRFLLLTDVPGVLDRDGQLIPELTAAEARRLIADGTISGGMIPKVETCLAAVEGGVAAAVIVDGRVPHAILLELFTEGAGTLIRSA
jgi:acetylglutamate kinase